MRSLFRHEDRTLPALERVFRVRLELLPRLASEPFFLCRGEGLELPEVGILRNEIGRAGFAGKEPGSHDSTARSGGGSDESFAVTEKTGLDGLSHHLSSRFFRPPGSSFQAAPGLLIAGDHRRGLPESDVATFASRKRVTGEPRFFHLVILIFAPARTETREVHAAGVNRPRSLTL